MQKKMQKKKEIEKTTTINAELVIPLGELAIYVLPKKENASSIVELLNTKPQVANFILEKMARVIIKKKKIDLKLMKLIFNYYDNETIERGTAYFKATLNGTERALRKMAGENKMFEYDWSEHQKNSESALTH